jgi:NAD(P)-dependent dehydrogenase (short-subunit alcohol dehydrogenase family)
VGQSEHKDDAERAPSTIGRVSYDDHMKNLDGKVAVVTGAASGIGLALSEMFIAEGMKVVLADIDEIRLADVEATFKADGADVASMVCDTSSERAVAALAEFTLERFGAAHVLCNNAGVTGLGDAWTDSMDLWHRTVGINLYGVVHGVRSFLPIMTAQGEGHIVNTASMAGLLAMPGGGPYNATKHAVVGLSEGLYLELKMLESPVEVSVLCPGWVKTRLMEHEEAVATSPIAKMMSDFARSSIENDSMTTAEVAQQVLGAIVNHQFWIVTHDSMRNLPITRMQRASDQTNPTL